ncbi:MmyB family transcriptional regulator, partial [Sphaerisporangium perillae]|uniref:MmyB family transcriptional regulator n=1 Tax=Sphaerisporangium perillae TaxID=2935860 RepID=UPI003FD72E52
RGGPGSRPAGTGPFPRTDPRRSHRPVSTNGPPPLTPARFHERTPAAHTAPFPRTGPAQAGTARATVSRSGRRALWAHPDLGELRLAYETFTLSDGEDQRLVVYLPAGEATSAVLDRLAGRRPGGSARWSADTASVVLA